MRNIYEDLVTMHKKIFHLHGLQQKCKDFVKTHKSVPTVIVVVHEWSMRYKGALLDLGKKTKQQAELEKARFQMLIHKNKQLASFIANM